MKGLYSFPLSHASPPKWLLFSKIFVSYLLVSSIYDSDMQIRRIDEYFLLSFRWASYKGTNKWIVASESNTPGRERMAWWIRFLACLDSSVVVDLKPESQFLWLGGRPCHVTSSCEQSRHMDAAWCVTFRGISTYGSECVCSTFSGLSACLPLGRILREPDKCICSSVPSHTVGIGQHRT